MGPCQPYLPPPLTAYFLIPTDINPILISQRDHDPFMPERPVAVAYFYDNIQAADGAKLGGLTGVLALRYSEC